MTGEQTLLVVNVSLQSSDRDYDETVSFLDHDVRLVRVGTDGDVGEAERLVRSWSGRADAIAVTGIREARAAGHLRRRARGHRARASARPTPCPSPTGTRCATSCRSGRCATSRPRCPATSPTRARSCSAATTTTAPCGCCASSRRTSSSPTRCCAGTCRPGSTPTPWWGRRGRGAVADPAAARPGAVDRAHARPPAVSNALAHRALATATSWWPPTTSSSASGWTSLAARPSSPRPSPTTGSPTCASRDVDMVLDATPQPFHVTVTAAVLEAMMLATVSGSSGRLTDDDLLDMIVSAGLSPGCCTRTGPGARAGSPSSSIRCRRSSSQVSSRSARSPRWRPAPVVDVLEKAMAYAPPFTVQPRHRHHVAHRRRGRGLAHLGGRHAQGADGAQPEFTYRAAARGGRDGRKLGAQVMGLGAFTKVVGDAGVTVAKRRRCRSPPATATAPRCAVGGARRADQLDLTELDEQGSDQGQGDGRGRDRGHRVGLRAAAGPVQRRAVAGVARDGQAAGAQARHRTREAPRDDPRGGRPNDHLADMDLIVTATSGAGKRSSTSWRSSPAA
jgi:hypothetical protein